MFGCAGWGRLVPAAAQSYALINLLPFSIANIGVREYSFGIFLSMIGGAAADRALAGTIAFGSSMVVLAVNIALPAAVGLGWELGFGAQSRAKRGRTD